MTAGVISETVLTVNLAPKRKSAIPIMLPEVIPSASMWVTTDISLPFSTTEQSLSQNGLSAEQSFELSPAIFLYVLL
jgi:hypothetical protein